MQALLTSGWRRWPGEENKTLTRWKNRGEGGDVVNVTVKDNQSGGSPVAAVSCLGRGGAGDGRGHVVSTPPIPSFLAVPVAFLIGTSITGSSYFCHDCLSRGPDFIVKLPPVSGY